MEKMTAKQQLEALNNSIAYFGLSRVRLEHVVDSGDKFKLVNVVTGEGSPLLNYDKMNHFILGIGSASKFGGSHD